MLIVMEMSSGKTLGEAVRREGGAHDDALLSAASMAAPRVEARLASVLDAPRGQSARTEAAGFLARRCAGLA